MSSVYLVQNVRGMWLRWIGRWVYSGDGDAVAFSSRGKAVALASKQNGTVVEFVPRAEVDELVSALRELHDFAEHLPHYQHDARSRQALEATAKALKKWEPSV